MKVGKGGVPLGTAPTFLALALWLLGIAFVRPLSVDESQYVAATALAAKGLLPYRDFAYLQTPLQPFLFAPLAWLFPGHLLIAMRVTNALLSLATIAFVHGAARRAGTSQRAALAAAAMLASCQSFLWCAGVARNDVLPAALMAFGLWLATGNYELRTRLGAGVAFGLAAGVKISYAIPAATVFLGGMWTKDPAGRRRTVAFAVGVALGLLPTVILAALAPRAFLAEAIIFPGTAPTEYYESIGSGWRLGPARFLKLLEAAAIGPALIAAVEVVRRGWKDRLWDDPVKRAMFAAAFGGLLSAGLNKPFQIFYLLPALPPLFVLAALLLSKWEGRPRWVKGAWALFIAIGLVPAAAWFIGATSERTAPPPIEVKQKSEALDEALRAHKVDGPVATLAGQYVENVDPRFAAGPFVYRTKDFVSPQQARDWHIVTGREVESLGKSPPAAIITGVYPDAQPKEEAELAAQAKALGYSPKTNAGGFTIWTRRP